MDMSKNNQGKISAFILCGPLIGTFIITITFHSGLFFYDPMRFLKGLITPSIIFPMIAAFILITPIGYLLGCIPAIITNLLFKHFFAKIVYYSLTAFLEKCKVYTKNICGKCPLSLFTPSVIQ